MSEITKISGVTFALCLILQSSALSAEFAGGTGEPNNPYQIVTSAQLVSIGSDPALLDKHFVLVNDIDLDPNQPGGQIFDGPVIGQSSSTPFEGALDGNGHNILNLTIDCNTPAGLIGEVGSKGQVYDLGLLGVSISGFSAGSLAAVNYGSIRDCYAAGIVIGQYNIGGLVGENQGSITGCYSICDVTGDWHVGGLVGSSEFGSTVTYCYATGLIDGDHDVGGLVGSSLSAYTGWCYAKGSVKGSERVGGLVGFSFGFEEVYLCYFLKAEDGGGPDNGNGIALTLSEIIQPASFVDWDFYGRSWDGLEDYWFMPPNSPPVLAWQTDITGLVEVPTLVGLTFDEAETTLTNAGFIVGTVMYDYDRVIPANHVVWSKPAGYAVAGTVIDIVVSSDAYDWADNPGQGSSEEPYQISSASQLESLADHPELCDKHFILIEDVNLAGRTYKAALITADANSAEDGFQGAPFTGSFDGNGFVIRYLTIEPDAPLEHGFFRANLGLFGRIGSEGKVHRVQLENVQIETGLVGTQWHVGSIGALAAENEGIISDCSVTGNIIGGQHTYGAGALVGINSGEIHSSYAGAGLIIGDYSVGGLVGRNENGTINNCYATISVEGSSDVGGLVGTNEEGILSFCYAAGPITAELYRSSGGLIGDERLSREGTIINCFWDMETTGQLRSSGGMGLGMEEMNNANIYALNGWAANSNWIIDDGKDYPRLAWENTVGTPIPEPVIDWLDGAGTSDDPYRITTAEQLSKVTISSVLFDKQFVLVADIDLESYKWHPIGFSSGTEFKGIFDGNDHVVSNLNMTDPNGPQYSGMGLFGYTANEAVIKHLILKNITVAEGRDRKYSGALVASNRGILKDCSVEATLTGSDCGGLVGENMGLIINCDSTCFISSDQSLDIVGFLAANNNGGSVFASRAIGSITCGDESGRIGGAIGRNHNHGIITACSADVTIACGDKSERIGGLIGFNQETTVSNSYATGQLNVGGQCNNIGGLVGKNSSNIVNCYVTGEIITGDETVDSGGLVGSQGSSGKVTGSYFLSPADGDGPNNGIGIALTDAQMRQQASFEEWDFVGRAEDGITDFWQMPDDGYPVLTLFDGYEFPVLAGTGTDNDPYLIDTAEQLGFIARNPDACYCLVSDLDLASINWTTVVIPLFYGHFDGNGHVFRNLSVTGDSDIGLFGTISAQATIENLGVIDANISGPGSSEHVAVMVAFNRGMIARCSVTGTVTGYKCVGGLMGENEGLVTDCYATCSVTGRDRTGGLVGENNGLIATSYVNGEVTSLSDEWSIGAFVGYNYGGNLVSCLWEKRVDMIITNDICQALKTEQMMDGEILGLNGWAENPNWVIDSGNDYPRLVWEGTPGGPIPVPTIDWLAGDGTPEDPYRIETVEQLKLIGTANILWDKHFILTADLDCEGVQFDCIGVCPGTGFSGDFDGANHHISNLTLGSDTPRQRNLGLFGYIDSEGSVGGLVMKNVQVSCGAFSGPLAALAAVNQGTIINCGVAVSLNCGESCWGIGGLVGENDGSIESCYADVAILVGDYSGSIGGLVADNDGRITNSYASGSAQAGFTARWFGGLVGLNDGPLIHCYAATDVSRKSSPFLPEMGGLVGSDFSESEIVSCYFLGRNNDMGIQLSSEQMKKQESFIGWDFVDETENGSEDIWWILEGQDYPRLWWELIE